jgi:hypothetical protein
MSKIAKFGREMLLNAENIALQSLKILYTFVLRAEIATIFGPNVVSYPLKWLQIQSSTYFRYAFSSFNFEFSHSIS